VLSLNFVEFIEQFCQFSGNVVTIELMIIVIIFVIIMITCVQVNGVSLISATHYQAVAVIKSAGNDMTMVVVKATTPPTDRQVYVSIYLVIFAVVICS